MLIPRAAMHRASTHTLVHAYTVHIQVPMFSKISQTCMSDLILKLRSRVYLPDELVIRVGDKGREMFFVLRGQYDVISKLGTNVCRYIGLHLLHKHA